MSEITQVVAIDGPAGAGKSSAAKRVAEALGFHYLDTGAMYRAATWWALDQGIDMDNAEALAEATACMPLEMNDVDGKLQVIVDGRDVTQAIRTPEVTRKIWRLDQNADVRAHLVELQREYGAKGPTVAEGRDIGTVVFPKAKCKVFLESSLDERTRRRARQLADGGTEVNFEALRGEIHERDEKTRTREVAPLRRAEDAVLLDSTDMTLEEVVDAIVKLARSVL